MVDFCNGSRVYCSWLYSIRFKNYFDFPIQNPWGTYKSSYKVKRNFSIFGWHQSEDLIQPDYVDKILPFIDHLDPQWDFI